VIGPTTRRSFLGGATASVAALALLRDPFALAGSRVPAARGGRFAQGVACGQPTTTGITLWSRVDELDGESRVQFEISPDRDFRRVVHRQEAVVSPENGFTALQRVDDARVLAPGQEYFYRCLTCDESSSVGRFRTARPADSAEPVRIGFFSCQDWEAGYYTAHAGLAAEDLDLVVCLGDYIYERSFYEGPRTDPIGESETLEQYRGKYALYHSDEKLRRVREQFPIMAIWDDHEVEDNHAAGEPGGATQSRDVPFAERRANAYRAFFEHMPRIRVPDAPTRIYGSVPLGGTAEVLLLDERQYRSDQPCNPDDEGFRDQQECPTNEPLYDPARTLLGAEQDAWLRDRLTASGATWKVVGNQVMAMAVDAPAGYPLNDDQWDGYGAERGELLEFVRARGVENLTFITGDIHTFFAGRVAPSGRTVDPDGPSPALGDDGRYSETPVATEFVGGSITSRGFGDAFPVESEFELEEQSTATAFEATVLANNPHMNYMDGKRRGYGVLIASPQELRVLFRTPRSTDTEESTVETTAEFVVAEGTTDVDIVRFTSGTGREP
jgi:alkaline phosphatase D